MTQIFSEIVKKFASLLAMKILNIYYYDLRILSARLSRIYSRSVSREY